MPPKRGTNQIKNFRGVNQIHKFSSGQRKMEIEMKEGESGGEKEKDTDWRKESSRREGEFKNRSLERRKKRIEE